MRINKVSSTTFKGLDISKASGHHIKTYIEPCFSQLKELGEKADIHLASRWNSFLRAPVFEYAVKPLNATGDKSVLRWSIIGSGYNLFSVETVVKKIGDAVRNLKP